MEADLQIEDSPVSSRAAETIVYFLENRHGRRGEGTIQFPTGPPFWMQLHGAVGLLQKLNLRQTGPTSVISHKAIPQVTGMPRNQPIWLQRFNWSLSAGGASVQAEWKRAKKSVVSATFLCDGRVCRK